MNTCCAGDRTGSSPLRLCEQPAQQPTTAPFKETLSNWPTTSTAPTHPAHPVHAVHTPQTEHSDDSVYIELLTETMEGISLDNEHLANTDFRSHPIPSTGTPSLCYTH